MTVRPLIVVGTGDHARVVIDLARACGLTPSGCVSPIEEETGPPARAVDGIPVIGALGDADEAPRWVRAGATFIVAIGDGERRRAAFDRCLRIGIEPATLIHPTATLLGGAHVEPGAQVCANAVIGLAARVGRNAIVNTAATIDHDNVIGEHAMIGPGAHLAGRVTVDEGAWVGIGAIVRQGIRIGPWSLVAAGAVVVRDVAAGTTVAGVPAAPMKGSPGSAQGE